MTILLILGYFLISALAIALCIAMRVITRRYERLSDELTLRYQQFLEQRRGAPAGNTGSVRDVAALYFSGDSTALFEGDSAENRTGHPLNGKATAKVLTFIRPPRARAGAVRGGNAHQRRIQRRASARKLAAA